MHTLLELKEYFIEHGIPVYRHNGFQIRVANDVWGMAHGDYYRNNVVTNPKDKKLLDEYKLIKPRMFKAIGAQYYNIEIEEDAGLV